MTSNNDATLEPNSEDIEMLLPWYATGKISAADRRRVEHYMAGHSEIAEQLTLVQEELDSTVAANEALEAPPAGSLDRLRARIMDEDGKAIRAAARPSSLAAIGDWLAGFGGAPALRLAAAAAAVVIVAQGAIIGSLLTGDDVSTRFETSSRPVEISSKSGAQLLIAFVEDASAGDIYRLIEEIDGTVIGGPTAGGIFKLQISKGSLPAETVDRMVTKLRKRTKVVRFVAVSD